MTIIRPSVIGHEILGISESNRQSQIDLANRQLNAQEDWHVVGAAGQPTYQNYFQNVGAVTAGYYKDTEDKVHFRGSVQVVAGGQPSGVNIFILPAGYRPAAFTDVKCAFLGKVHGAGAGTAAWYLTVEVCPTGEVRVPTAYDIVALYLDSIIFWATQ